MLKEEENQFLGLCGFEKGGAQRIFIPLHAILYCKTLGHPDDVDGLTVRVCIGDQIFYNLTCASVLTFGEYMEDEYDANS